MNSNFEIEIHEKSNENMINLKKSAMQNKKNYIEKSNISKDVFLNQYSESGKILEIDYKNYSIDEESLKIIMGINLENIIKSRIENAEIIYEKLKNNKYIEFLIKDYNKKDALLFVPIIIEHTKRNRLRNYLTENQIYLPIHWPLEEKNNNIFEKELSLVCDQRYTCSDISQYINLILKNSKILEEK